MLRATPQRVNGRFFNILLGIPGLRQSVIQPKAIVYPCLKKSHRINH
jgi:hypothetical protein